MIKGLKGLLKYSIYICAKLILVLLIVLASFTYLSDIFYNKDVDYGDSFKSLKENSMDIIALGSSHLQYSFIPSIIYSNTGLYAYSLGTGCQPYSVSFEMLKEALKTQSPKLVVLEVYTALPFKPGCDSDSCYVLAQYQMSGREKIRTISYMSDQERAKEYNNDFINYHNNWKTVGSFEDLTPRYLLEKKFDANFGYIPWMEEVTYEHYWRPVSISMANTYEQDLKEEDLRALNNIKSLCDKKDIQLLLYMAPMDGLDEENLSYLKSVWDWANENNVEYIDFNELAVDMDFYMHIHSGGFHSYTTGAVMMSDVLADKIKEFDFNHSDDEELNDLYKHSAQYITATYLKNENRPSTFMKALESISGTVILRYHPTFNPLEKEVIKSIQNMGVEDFDGSKYTYLLIEDGEIMVLSETPVEEMMGKHNVKILENGIEVDGAFYNSYMAPFTIAYIDEYENELVIKNVYYEYEWWTLGEKKYDRDWD